MKIFTKKLLICLALSFILLPNTITKAEDISNSTISASPNSDSEENSKEYNNINVNNVVEVFNQNNSNLSITMADIDLMAKLVYAESRGEPFNGQIAVASVVLNRVLDKSFPNTISEVVFQKNAFSCVKNGNIEAYPDQSCYNAVYKALSGEDPTNNALFFYNPKITTSSWMLSKEKKDALSIGNHVFFKL